MVRLAKVPPLVCHHCGQDYARDYWAATPTLEQPKRALLDPRVCPSCRRDLNPDAADAPRWSPLPKLADAPALVAVVSPARKQCRVCRGEWDGLVLAPPASKGSPLPFGICPPCADADEARGRPIVTLAAAPVPVLQRPTRVFGYDD